MSKTQDDFARELIDERRKGDTWHLKRIGLECELDVEASEAHKVFNPTDRHRLLHYAAMERLSNERCAQLQRIVFSYHG